MSVSCKQKVIVVGAGPVGALAALYAARRGYNVEVYELRSDLRNPSTTPLNFTKSINLALSERGVNSLRYANCPGLLESILDNTIPMHGRMIHGKANNTIFEQAQTYDVHGRFIRAADRAGLNKCLLDALEKMPNVKLAFGHKLTGADFKSKRAWFEMQNMGKNGSQDTTSNSTDKRAAEIEIHFDFMIGADGAHSAVRFHLMKFARMSYQQEYINTLWCEFHIPPAAAAKSNERSDGFKLSPNHLHIWPAGSMMFIAIPSMDKSFTCTLFMSASQFDTIDADPTSLLPFFEEQFPGVAPALIHPSDLQKQYSQNPHLPLISIKCTPYHYGSGVVIVGDAAHAMVPFYGQGMNAGLEDVRVLFDILDKHTHFTGSEPEATAIETGRAMALEEYTRQRTPDAHTINDLAMANYEEMRSDVRSPFYLLRKSIEERLDLYIPSLGFATRYARISFSNERYSDVEKAVKRQGLTLGLSSSIIGALLGVVSLVVWRWRWHRS